MPRGKPEETARGRTLENFADWSGGLLDATLAGLFTPGAARAALLLVAVLLTAAAYFRPEYNWDMLAYIGSALEGRLADIKSLHAHVFDSVRQAIRPEGWQKLTQGTAWREGAYSSPQMYGSVLELYRVKLLFVAAVAMLAKLVGIAHAPWVLGWLFGILSLVLCFQMLRRLGLERYFVLAIPVILGANLQWTTRLPTPDSMAGFLMLAAAYVYAFKSRPAAYLLFALSVLTRPDSLVFVAALVLVQAARRDLKLTEVVAATVPVLGYLLATRIAGHSGWWPHFYYTHVKYVDMTGFAIPFQFKIYAAAVVENAAQALMKYGWLHVYLLLLAAHAALRRGIARSDQWDALMLATLIAIAARAVVFPHMTGRVMCATVLVAAFALAGRIAASYPELVRR